ncbi:MAG: hypothetical protein ABSG74_10560 [Candidatus Bathyarchaeia archaeon]|jgi:hypothetical protein
MRAHHKKGRQASKPEAVTIPHSLNDLVHSAIRSATEIIEMGKRMEAPATNIADLKTSSALSLGEIAQRLTQLAGSLAESQKAQSESYKIVKDTVESIGKNVQKSGADMTKELESLDLQLRIERQFSRYLT